ncbi:hypothetical protein [Paenibacillus sp. 1P07SE]|uniref:hypothetical protein n=1 Tax=Paenibacillus sp. 1P07SE TaxID=3132209 RepID=UPI0039A70380
MKKILKGVILALGLALILLVLTCPNDDDYVVWLEREHQIKCVNGECTKGEETMDWRSRATRNAGVYQRIIENYRGPSGERVEIRAMGLLGRYYAY